jgi:EpsI family protein
LPVPLQTDLKFFPLHVGEWNGWDALPDHAIFQSLNADHVLSRAYQDGSGHTLHLYVGYLERQRQDKKLNVDDKLRSDASDHGTITLSNRKDTPLTVNRFVHRADGNNTLLLSWYDINGLVLRNPYAVKIHSALDFFTHRRSNGAVISVSISYLNDNDLPGALSASSRFITDVIPLLDHYLPRQAGTTVQRGAYGF